MEYLSVWEQLYNPDVIISTGYRMLIIHKYQL